MSEIATRKDRAWITVGKFATVVSLLGGVAGLWVFISAPAQDLQATVTFGPNSLPPSAEAFLQWSEQSTSLDEFKKILSPPADDSPEAFTLRQAALTLSGHFLSARANHPTSFTSLGGYWHASIVNHGDLAATDVTLALPDVREASIIRGDKEQVVVPQSGRVSIGIVRPKESLTVLGWTLTPPWDFNTKNVVLAHARGVGSITALTPRPPLGRQLLAYWPLILIALGVILPTWLIAKLTTGPKTAREETAESDSAHDRPQSDA